MGEPYLVVVVDNRQAMRLFLSALLKSVGAEVELIAVSRLAHATDIIKRGRVQLVVVGLEKHDPARKVAFLKQLSTVSPNTSAVLVYDSEHSVKTPGGGWITEAWPKLAYFTAILEASACRAVLRRALKSADSARKID